jgi:NAD(P)-dependent dehydrogenase (short-subunit alcohol dehydrogenase family)
MLSIDLSGRVALVLGGSRGIGAGITKELCKAGAYTLFTHTGNPKNRENIEALIMEIKSEGGSVEEAELDALDNEGTDALVKNVVSRLKKIDILVCNVGRNAARPIEDITVEDWKKFIDLNLSSAFFGIKAVLPFMVEKGYGRILLIGSSAVFDGGGGAIDYAAAKAGMTGIMKYLCRIYTKKGINTNVIHPCVIATDLVRERYHNEELWHKLVSQIPVGRAGTPRDIAGIVAYLASDWGDYICGQEILLDGGRTMFNK